jgi:hypothetical protein
VFLEVGADPVRRIGIGQISGQPGRRAGELGGESLEPARPTGN